MSRLVRLIPVVAMSMVAYAQLFGQASDSGRLLVGPNIRVSVAADREHEEVHLTADPENAKHLAACSMVEGRPGAGIPSAVGTRTVLYLSRDGGRSWSLRYEDSSLVAAQNDLPNSWDPTCEFGRRGVLYFGTATHMMKGNSAVSRIRIHRSSDGGNSWLAPTVIDAAFVDKPWIVADTRLASHYIDRVYVGYTAAEREPNGSMRASLLFSKDGAASFERSGGMGNPGSGDIGGGVVLSDGTVAFVMDTDSPQVLVSRDGGHTFEVTEIAPGIRSDCQCMASIAADASRGKFRDRLYVVWGGVRDNRSRVMLAYSEDHGRSWSPPRIVSDDSVSVPQAKRINSIMPAVAVNRRGVVGVSWYDRRDNPDDIGYYVRFSASLDGGKTWLPSVRVSEQPNVHINPLDSRIPIKLSAMDPLPRRDTATSTIRAWMSRSVWYTGGHFAGLAADADGVFHPLWVDNRTGLKQVWTATVRVGENSLRSEAVATRLRDVTGAVSVHFDDLIYLRTGTTTALLTFDIRLTNISRDTLRAPLNLEVVEFAPQTAPPGAAADWQLDREFRGYLNARRWDLNSGLREGQLPPNSTSTPIRVQMLLTNLRVPPDTSFVRAPRFEARLKILESADH